MTGSPKNHSFILLFRIYIASVLKVQYNMCLIIYFLFFYLYINGCWYIRPRSIDLKISGLIFTGFRKMVRVVRRRLIARIMLQQFHHQFSKNQSYIRINYLYQNQIFFFGFLNNLTVIFYYYKYAYVYTHYTYMIHIHRVIIFSYHTLY